jgi:hypothetical protein
VKFGKMACKGKSFTGKKVLDVVYAKSDSDFDEYSDSSDS